MQNRVLKSFEASSSGRLDGLLASMLGVSRGEAKKIIEGGFCEISGKKTLKASHEVKNGEFITVFEYLDSLKKPKEPSSLAPAVIFEDDDILVISKPSGLIVHEGNGTTQTTLVDWLKSRGYPLADGTGEGREGIVHRLDRETSGLMVVAKNNTSADFLKDQFRDKSAGRYYLAIIEPPLREDVTVEATVGRNQKNRVKMSVQKEGKEAKSLFKKITLSSNGAFELIGAKLFTGRTHQIRAHLSHIGRHIVGDALYGFKSQNAKIEEGRVMLHAAVLYFIHPKTKSKVAFFDAPPNDFLSFFHRFFLEENNDELFSQSSICSLFGGDN